MAIEISSNAEEYSALADKILKLAAVEGASQAQVSLSHSTGLSLRMRQGRVTSRMRETHSGFTLTVFNGQKKGSVNSTDLRGRTLEDSVKAACAIARFTGEDAAAGLASPEQLCRAPKELSLFHPWDLDEAKAMRLAARMEEGLASVGDDVQSEGVWINSNQLFYLLATSEGFNSSTTQSFHNLGASALGRNARVSEMDMWSEGARNFALIPQPEDIGRKAGVNARAYLNQQPLTSRRSPVLFDARSACSLIGHLTQAISDQALYTGSSFLRNKLGQQVLADHVSLYEDPYALAGNSSLAFDSDGIAPLQRYVVNGGSLNGYFLSLYGARRLGLTPTGNGFGPSNLLLSSSRTQSRDDFPAMLKALGTGLLVTSLTGNGIRMITGDYSRGARGFWVENGVIQHAVTGITISGNLAQMFMGSVGLGSDRFTQGSFSTGSILVDQMQISGE